MHSLDDYIYELPESAIGQELASPPDRCKFLVYDTSTKETSHHIFHEIERILPTDSLLIFNTSKVVKARLYLPSLKGEIFFLRAHDEYTFDALIRPGKKFQVGDLISLDDTEITFTVVEMTENGRRLQCSEPILDVLEEYGHMPLPPYISYSEDKSGAYQPLQAKQPGSVAAPTASLHFTEKLLSKLRSQGIQTDETVLHI